MFCNDRQHYAQFRLPLTPPLMKNDDSEEMIYGRKIQGCVFKAHTLLTPSSNMPVYTLKALPTSGPILRIFQAPVLFIAPPILLEGPCMASLLKAGKQTQPLYLQT